MIIKKTLNGIVVSEEVNTWFTAEACVIGPMSDPAYNLKKGEDLHYFLVYDKCICGRFDKQKRKNAEQSAVFAT